MTALFLPQIHWAGYDEFITTFTPASARFSVFGFSKTRSELCFTMKQNLPCRLPGLWAGSKQPVTRETVGAA
jgi:hypothetical protein